MSRLLLAGIFAALVSAVLVLPASAVKEEVPFTLTLEGALGKPQMAQGTQSTVPLEGIVMMEINGTLLQPADVIDGSALAVREGPDLFEYVEVPGGVSISLLLPDLSLNCIAQGGLNFDLKCNIDGPALQGTSHADGKGEIVLNPQGGLEGASISFDLTGDLQCVEINCGLNPPDPPVDDPI